MKCTQCGCNNLVKVDFPYETGLIEDVVGLSGYTAQYSIINKADCNSYICTNCGHFEFFNLKLAEKIKHDMNTALDEYPFIIKKQ